jgi:hypothetical protein
MTEAEWMACGDLGPMLEYMQGKTSDRKLRLILCGWSRLNWKWLPEKGRSAVEVAELFADELASDADRKTADAELWWAIQGRQNTFRHWLARLTLEGSIDLWAAAHASASRNPKVRKGQIAVLNEVFSNPFRPVTIETPWLAGNDGAARKIAQTIYDARRFADLPILADALEDAGCTDAAILAHCRGGGEHVRGCWVVDLLLGKV